MRNIELLYCHKGKDKRTLLEDCIAELNKKGGLKRPFPNEDQPRIPLVVDVKEDGPVQRKVMVYAESLGRNDIDNRIEADYDRETGKETVTMPYGWCGLHLYFERKGFSTERQ